MSTETTQPQEAKHRKGWNGECTEWVNAHETATPGVLRWRSKHKVAHCECCQCPWGTGMVFYAPVIVTPDGRDLTRYEPCPQCRQKDGTPKSRNWVTSGRGWVFWDYTYRYDDIAAIAAQETIAR